VPLSDKSDWKFFARVLKDSEVLSKPAAALGFVRSTREPWSVLEPVMTRGAVATFRRGVEESDWFEPLDAGLPWAAGELSVLSSWTSL
jgi:hypothetical protein